MTTGRFISFEGGEGVGKSTQIKALASFLEQAGHQVVLTREPGGCPAAEDVRNLLVQGDVNRFSAVSETLLFYVARYEHVQQVIKPALQAGKWVLCDRFSDSTRVYQGYAGDLGLQWVEQIDQLVLKGFKPDLTLILDMDVDIAAARAKQRGGVEDRFERKGLEYHQAVRRGFLQLATDHAQRCRVVDVTGDVQQVLQRLINTVQTVYPELVAA